MDFDQVAKICHEANRAYCQTLGDNSQQPWEDSPEWQRVSARKGVEFHFAHFAKLGTVGSPGASHLKWLEEKEVDGWKYGPVKNLETKEHPCYRPYEELPIEQRRKDYIFAAICEAFCKSSEYEAVA